MKNVVRDISAKLFIRSKNQIILFVLVCQTFRLLRFISLKIILSIQILIILIVNIGSAERYRNNVHSIIASDNFIFNYILLNYSLFNQKTHYRRRFRLATQFSKLHYVIRAVLKSRKASRPVGHVVVYL